MQMNRLAESTALVCEDKRLTRNERRKLIRQAVIACYGRQCFYCSAELADDCITMDHVVPAAKGGPFSVDNLRPACVICNTQKSDSSVEVFLASLTALGSRAAWEAVNPASRSL